MGASFSFDREDEGPEGTAGAAAAPSGDTSGAPAGEGNSEVCIFSGVVECSMPCPTHLQGTDASACHVLNKAVLTSFQST